jgi:uncharacterized RDD family membrane protein YckC
VDPEEYAEASERLERDYLAGGMSADEYTQRRRALERDASGDSSPPESTAEAERPWQPVPPRPSSETQPVPTDADPVTGAGLASWGRRAGGWFVDLVVYAVVFIATFLVALSTEDPVTGEISDAAALLLFFVWFLGPTIYAWLMVGAFGQTLGKMAVGIRVVGSAGAARVSFARAFGRAASTWLLGVFLVPILLAYLWPLWDRRNQTLYDKMAGTIVVVT